MKSKKRSTGSRRSLESKKKHGVEREEAEKELKAWEDSLK
jgi:hypothetical protein